MSKVDYNKLINIMMYMVIRDALIIISQDQSKNPSHHIRISFLTDVDDVVIPDYLKKAYPREMSIVLQHQFNDLKVDDCHFSVVLSFNGKKEKIIVPFVAITEYIDVDFSFSMSFNKNQDALLHEVQIFLSQNYFSTTQIHNTVKSETSDQNQTNNIIFLNKFLKDN